MGKFLGWGVLSPTVPIYVTVSFIRIVVALCACPYLEGPVAMSLFVSYQRLAVGIGDRGVSSFYVSIYLA